MGTSFFRGAGGPKIGGPKIGGAPQNMEARAIGSGVYAARGAAAGAQKDIGAASAINKAAKFKPSKGSSAYPKGPKV